MDEHGTYCLDNVDVGGALVPEDGDLWFIAGILNAPVAGWVFRRISKPFRGDYRSANKQFIAPLPVPPAMDAQRATVAAGARELQSLHTQQRDLLASIARRLGTVRTRARPEPWLFPGLVPAATQEADAPAGLDTAERRAWARTAYETDLETRQDALGSAVRPGTTLDADLADGELRLLANGVPVLDRIFVTATEGAFLLAQWKVLAFTLAITERLDGKALSRKLRTLAIPDDNPAVVEQVVANVAALGACEAAIRTAEAAMNEVVFALYGLTAAERALVAAG